MFDQVNDIFQVTITPADLLRSLFVAFLCGLIVSWFYRKTYKGPGYLNSFVNSLVILAMITAVVIMVIGNNLARAFGLVGAMSIVRFRTAVKETQDIIYIFYSLAMGMAAGVGLYTVAIVGTIGVGLISLMLSRSSLVSPAKKDFLLQFNYKGNGDGEPEFMTVVNHYCKRSRLINAKSVGPDDAMEYSYNVGFKNQSQSTDLIRDLRKINGINHVNLFFDEEYF
ncbi:MAG: DUF4956 domain-containing protein [Bacteroidetes bacterium]|nr:DUF4956 domain-containing protein [Bacteroidota bacterium]MBU1679017.1 DUF4956 domain-containing protein [Bacteroidota bacterium]MBU2505819.1 DUF4956 domain-containing protein [Bacteroidota bacterium]